MTQKRLLHDQAQATLIQQHQLNQTNEHLNKALGALDVMAEGQRRNNGLLDKFIAQAERSIDGRTVGFVTDDSVEVVFDNDLVEARSTYVSTLQPLEMLGTVDLDPAADWTTYRAQLDDYAAKQSIESAQDPFHGLMTDSQRISLEKRIQEEFSFKAASCDKYDYMIAGTCGLIGGLVDALFVGVPGKGVLGKWGDTQTDSAVQAFAKLNGWNRKSKEGDGTASAIGFLERKFKINYDQATTHATGGAVQNMSMSNHHLKSLAHSPDLVGLFFSILDQFTNSAHFVDKGKLISIKTETFELSGSNPAAKIFAGFTNWVGHLFSDMAGSSGGRGNKGGGRGSGIPIPFYSLLQFLNIGSFGRHRQSFSTIAVKVFESGYDMRHGLAMSIPVLMTELLTRMMWVLKRRFYHGQEWRDCVPSANNPELRRMLLIGHGSLCLVDVADAGLRSGGDIVTFLVRSNMIAWVRFGTVAIKEVRAVYLAGSIDADAIDAYLDAEYLRMMAA